jgi:hypothetical protein
MSGDPENVANSPPAAAAAGGGGAVGAGFNEGDIVQYSGGRGVVVMIDRVNRVYQYENFDEGVDPRTLLIDMPADARRIGRMRVPAVLNEIRGLPVAAAAERVIAARRGQPIQGVCGSFFAKITNAVKKVFTKEALIATGSVAAIILLALTASILEDASNAAMYRTLTGEEPSTSNLLAMANGTCSVQGGGKRKRKSKSKGRKTKSKVRRSKKVSKK